MNIYKDIYRKIKKYEKIVIARHIGPDPDAVASEIALRDSIKLTFPKKCVYAIGTHVSRFKYLGILDKVNDNEMENALLIVIDNPVSSRIDGTDYTKYKEIILIDHHPSDDLKAKVSINFVDTTACSAAQLITKLLLKTPLIINKEIAEKLFVGIVSDSDRFLLSYTTSETFEIVSLLLKKYKLDFVKMYNNIYERPFNEIKFYGYIATHMTVTENGFGYIILDNKDLNEIDMDVDILSASNMVNDFNYIKELFAWAFAIYDDKSKLYKINIRSRGPVINETANRYNGGGHKQASGARIEELDNVKMLFNDLDEICKKYKEENDN